HLPMAALRPWPGTNTQHMPSVQRITADHSEHETTQALQVDGRRRVDAGKHPVEIRRLGRVERKLPSTHILTYVEVMAVNILVDERLHWLTSHVGNDNLIAKVTALIDASVRNQAFGDGGTGSSGETVNRSARCNSRASPRRPRIRRS